MRSIDLEAPRSVAPVRQLQPAERRTGVGARTTRRVVYCRPNDSLATVLRLLTENQLDWLPVVSGPGKLVGIISLDDIARSIDERDGSSPEPRASALASARGGA